MITFWGLGVWVGCMCLLVRTSSQAAALCRSLGFTNVVEVKPGSSAMVKGVEISAFKGSLVGPPWSEPQNGCSCPYPAEYLPCLRYA